MDTFQKPGGVADKVHWFQSPEYGELPPPSMPQSAPYLWVISIIVFVFMVNCVMRKVEVLRVLPMF